MHLAQEQLMGKLAGHFLRFPLLLKFLDALEMLSVQVHPAGLDAKTEAWVVLELGKASCIYVGLKPHDGGDPSPVAQQPNPARAPGRDRPQAGGWRLHSGGNGSLARWRCGRL